MSKIHPLAIDLVLHKWGLVITLVLAIAPDGLAKMAIVGFSLGADIAFILSHQLIRFSLCSG